MKCGQGSTMEEAQFDVGGGLERKFKTKVGCYKFK